MRQYDPSPSIRLVDGLTGTIVEPILAADLKVALRIDTSAEDAYLTLLCQTARQMAEKITGRYLIERQFTMWMPGFPGNRANDNWWEGHRDGPETWLNGGVGHDIVIPRTPIMSVDEVATYDTTDTKAVLDATTVYASSVQDPNRPGRIRLKFGQVWPPTILRTIDGVSVKFTAGYGGTGGSTPHLALPFDLKLALLQFAGEMYNKRGDQSLLDTTNVSAASVIFSRYQMMSLS